MRCKLLHGTSTMTYAENVLNGAMFKLKKKHKTAYGMKFHPQALYPAIVWVKAWAMTDVSWKWRYWLE